MNLLFCGEEPIRDLPDFEHRALPAKKQIVFRDELLGKRFLPFTDAEAYRLLKVATEAFVVVNCGVP